MVNVIFDSSWLLICYVYSQSVFRSEKGVPETSLGDKVKTPSSRDDDVSIFAEDFSPNPPTKCCYARRVLVEFKGWGKEGPS